MRLNSPQRHKLARLSHRLRLCRLHPKRRVLLSRSLMSRRHHRSCRLMPCRRLKLRRNLLRVHQSSLRPHPSRKRLEGECRLRARLRQARTELQ